MSGYLHSGSCYMPFQVNTWQYLTRFPVGANPFFNVYDDPNLWGWTGHASGAGFASWDNGGSWAVTRNSNNTGGHVRCPGRFILRFRMAPNWVARYHWQRGLAMFGVQFGIHQSVSCTVNYRFGSVNNEGTIDYVWSNATVWAKVITPNDWLNNYNWNDPNAWNESVGGAIMPNGVFWKATRILHSYWEDGEWGMFRSETFPITGSGVVSFGIAAHNFTGLNSTNPNHQSGNDNLNYSGRYYHEFEFRFNPC